MRKDDCIFCKIAAGEIPSTTLYEDDYFRVFFDVAPASKGHCLIVPKEHFDNVYEMSDEVGAKIIPLASKVASALKRQLNCDGLNIVQNNGEIAGQTVFHYHMHVIPRYEGDTVNVTWKQGQADMDELAKLTM